MAFFTCELIIFLILLLCRLSSAVDSIRPFQPLSDDKSSGLVSKQGDFELGFFSTRAGSRDRYLGIWYKKIPVQTVVWVANRCDPVKDSSGTLMINSTGSLVLLNRNKTVLWSTSTTKQAKKPIVELLGSGNLVLRDEEDKNPESGYLWQSFDYPSDTLLPGMKMGWDLRTGIKRGLSAWKSMDDPCPGDLTYGIEFDPKLHNFPEAYFWKGTAKFYRSGPWNGLRFSGALALRPNPLYRFYFVYDDNEVYYMYDLINVSVVSRVVMNQTTSLRQRLTWIEGDQTWRAYSNVPRDQCDEYGICGANSNCIFGGSPICQCLKGFKPRYQDRWNSMDWTEGCVRNSPLSCGKEEEKDGYARFSGLKVPDTTHSWVNKTMDLKECKAKCLSNCNCTAYTNSDIRGKGSGCVIWFGNLVDIREFPSGGQDLFIRMLKSELGKGDSEVRVVMIVAIVGGVSGMILVLCYYLCKRRGLKDKTDTNEPVRQVDEDQEEDLELPLLSLSTLTTATENFSPKNKLGEGGFGPVFRGKLEDGQEIAVKRLSISSGQGVTELRNEVKLIVKLQHRNLVKLLGCCIHDEEKLLVYEFMPNRSLDSFIFDKRQGKLLGWSRRFQIVYGIARGLLYLHQDSRLRVIHRDLKASNILLDNEMNPRISDFGLARTFGGDQIEDMTSRVMGTYGYMAPEYAFDGLFSIKSDVFSFGILVLEIVSGKRSRGFHHENHCLTLIGHAWTLQREGSSYELLDNHLRDSDHDLREVLRCIHIGLLCVQHNPADRPTMSSVVLMLGGENDLPPPKQPGYFVETDLVLQGYYSSTKPESSSTNEMSMSQLEAR